MCLARERRVIRQKRLMSQYNSHLISFTLNIPGEVKDNEFYRKIFMEGIISASNYLYRNKIMIKKIEYHYEITGAEGYFIFDFEPKIVKKIMLEFEENHPLGRIFDFDVIYRDGIIISRLDFTSTSERKCYICEKPAKICARSQNHSIKEILSKIEEMSNTFFNSQNTLLN